MRRFATAALVLGFLPYLLGAGIFLTVTTNPGGQGSKIKGSGIWTLLAGETFGGSIVFDVTLKGTTPPQHTNANANRGFDGTNMTWDSTLSVVPGTYIKVNVTLNYLDNQQRAQKATSTDPNEWAVN